MPPTRLKASSLKTDLDFPAWQRSALGASQALNETAM